MKGIYKIYCTKNGKSYIGSSVRVSNRWSHHKLDLIAGKHCNPYLQRAWNKYGSESFIWILLEPIQNESDLLIREQFWIDNTPKTFNARKLAHTNLGIKHSAEAKQRRKGRKLSPEHKRKIAESMRGHKLSEETKAKISLAHANKQLTPEHKAKISATKRRSL